MRILGIDPGYAIVGYGVLDYRSNHFGIVDFGAITTPAGMDFGRRLEIIYDEMQVLIEKTKPEAMAIEKLFYNTNAKTVIDVGQARGVLLLAEQKNHLPPLLKRHNPHKSAFRPAEYECILDFRRI